MDAVHVDVTSTLRDFSLTVSLAGRSLALVGPSGAGKSTILRCIAGLRRPEAGSIRVGAVVLFDHAAGVDLPPERRGVGMVFQEYALFPHLTVRGNVAYGGTERVDELLERFRIAHLADARPRALSGGERQRVALARALARDPQVVLLDEPLAALDADTRIAVRDELAAILTGLAIPRLVVTHDLDDAEALADEIVVLERGRVVQAGSAGSLAAAPASPFVEALTASHRLRSSS